MEGKTASAAHETRMRAPYAPTARKGLPNAEVRVSARAGARRSIVSETFSIWCFGTFR